MGRLTLCFSLLLSAVTAYNAPYTSSSPCAPHSNGAFPGNACNRQYSLCVDGVHQSALCQDNFVFFQTKCVPINESPECAVEQDDDTNEEPSNNVESTDFDCSSRDDGAYAQGCQNQFIQCAAGYSYAMYCPSDLVFVEKYARCLSSCDEVVNVTEDEDVTSEPTTDNVLPDNTYEEGANEYQTEKPPVQADEPLFDCSALQDGIYANGCSSFYFACSNGNSYVSHCPSGLFYNAHQKACEYDCEDVTTTTTTTSTTTTTASPVTDVVDDVPDTSTQAYIDVPVATPETTSTTTTTAVPTTTTTVGFDDGNNTKVCVNGQISTFGQCSSRFTKCRNNAIEQKQCPVSTLFEPDVLLCVYDSPLCQAAAAPISYNPTMSDVVLSPFDESSQSVQKNYRPRPPVYRRYDTVPTVENPFFIPEKHNRPRHHHKNHHHEHRRHRRPQVVADSPFAISNNDRVLSDDSFKDWRRTRSGRLAYGNSRGAAGDKVLFVGDQFDGPKSRNINSDIYQVFPRSATRRTFGPRGITDDEFSTFIGPSSQSTAGTTAEANGKKVVAVQAISQVSSEAGPVQTTSSLVESTTTPVAEIITTTVAESTTTPVAQSEQGQSVENSVEGSGDEAETSTTATRRKRSYGYGNEPGYTTRPVNTRQDQVNNYCRQIVTPTFLVFGQCQQDFVYCSGTGVNRMAACPVGELFDKTVGQCRQSCGILPPSASPPVVTPATPRPQVLPQSTPSSDTGSSTSSPPSIFPRPDLCLGLAEELVSIGECSQHYIQCSSGVAIKRTCPAALYFDETSSMCDFRYNVAQCSDDATTVAPIDNDVPTSTYVPVVQPYSPTSTSAPEDISSTAYAPEVKPYNPTSYDNVPPADDTTSQENPCNSLSDGPHGEGCSASYFVCSGGSLKKTLTCGLGQGFDTAALVCKKFELIAACNSVSTTTDAGLTQPLPYVSLESVTTTTTEATTTTTQAQTNDDAEQEEKDVDNSYENDESDDETTSPNTESDDQKENSYDEETTTTEYSNDEVESDAEDDVEKEETPVSVSCVPGTRASLGSCQQSFLECDSVKKSYEHVNCAGGQLFDSESQKCVDKDFCGSQNDVAVTSTPQSYKSTDGRCANAAENATRSIGSCRTSYIRCVYGQPIVEYCHENKIFSKAHSSCVNRDSVSECGVSPIPTKNPYTRPAADADSFCFGRPDGLYRNPGDCSGILQCFGGDMFEYPSCPSKLSFNELTGKCDYAQNVRGCSEGEDEECDVHGAFLADPDNCDIFYRCVWGRKVSMSCPSGTVFNPSLSVCDWPTSVPSCSAPSSDSGSNSYQQLGY